MLSRRQLIQIWEETPLNSTFGIDKADESKNFLTNPPNCNHPFEVSAGSPSKYNFDSY